MSSRLIAHLVHCDPGCLCCTEQQRLFCSFLSAVKVSPVTRIMERLQSTVQQPWESRLRSWWPHWFPPQGSCQADSSHSWYIVTQVSLLHRQSCVDPRWMHLVFKVSAFDRIKQQRFSVVSCRRSRFRPLTRIMEQLQSTVQQSWEG